jgi:superfamily II DNA or RNA helicase
LLKELLDSFDNLLKDRLATKLRTYQTTVIKELLSTINSKENFIIVSMPTGSGKTLLEMFMTYYILKLRLSNKVLVLEPTRFLCDQMASRGGPWKRLFGNLVEKEYEGDCIKFSSQAKAIISTPKTSLKCLDQYRNFVKAVIVDEAHHIFGGTYYEELLSDLNPELVVGFTALLPSYKIYRASSKLLKALGSPKLMTYDFKKLKERDPYFKLPKAIADVFDSELNELEDMVYDKLFKDIANVSVKHQGIIGLLESTLARYGKEAFCETFNKSLSKGVIAGEDPDIKALCTSQEPSHKARSLVEVLSSYNINENAALRPVLIFTSRRATANEFKRVVINNLNIPSKRIEVLTGEKTKEERIEIVNRAKEGDIDIIISTLVGEEGIDIPEAGLLVMTDVPGNPLRFYQRLGRLIRLSSKDRLKYLVFSLTPRTLEYQDLDQALLRLSMEGVDVSYVIVGIEKTVKGRVLDEIKKLLNVYGKSSLPYSLLALKEVGEDPLTALVDKFLDNLSKSGPDLVRSVKDLIDHAQGLDPDDLVAFFALSPKLSKIREFKKILRKAEESLKSRLSIEIEKLIEKGELLYVYDENSLSELLAKALYVIYKNCKKEGRKLCRETQLRLGRRDLLRLFLKLFTPERVSSLFADLLEDVRAYSVYTLGWEPSNERKFEVIRREGPRRFLDMLKTSFVDVKIGNLNTRSRTLPLKLFIEFELNDIKVNTVITVNYYISDFMMRDPYYYEELFRANLIVTGFKALLKFARRIEEELFLNNGKPL